MSERHNIQEATLRNWANLGLITSSRIGNQQFLDNESLTQYLDAHQRVGVSEGYLAHIIEEKRLEKEFVLSKYEDELYLLKTQKECASLFKTVIRELAQLIVHTGHRALFYAISMGEPIDRVANRHHMSYDRTLKTYDKLLEGLKKKQGIIAGFRKRSIDYQFKCQREEERINQLKEKLKEFLPADNNLLMDMDQQKVIGNQYSSSIVLKIPIRQFAEIRTANVLDAYNIHTVEQLLKYALENGWNNLRNMDGMGKTSYIRLIKKLQEIKIIDDKLYSRFYEYM